MYRNNYYLNTLLRASLPACRQAYKTQSYFKTIFKQYKTNILNHT